MKRILLTGLCSIMLFVGIKAQTTVTITATGTAGSFNSGSVNAGGTKNDGDMITINSGANAGWAKFDLSSLPASAVVTAASCLFTTYSSITSGASNNLYGFIGNPAGIAGAALYTNCTSGTTFNNTTWTANALNTKVLNAAGISFIASNITSTQLCIGYARASTNTYNIYGYGAAAASLPKILITYTVPPACSGTPTSGTATASSTVFCTPRTINLNLAGSTSATGLTYQWLSSPTGVSYSSISSATNIAYSPIVSSTTYFQCVVSCGVSSSTSTPVMINYGPAPTGGTSVASQTYICASPNVALSTTGSSTVSGTTYQWQSSPNGSTWTSIPSQTLSTANPTISTTTYYQNVLTCGTGTAASSSIMVTVAPTVTNSISYSEGFEGITANDQLPNCSWAASSLGSICKTYTAATGSYNQIPKTGSKFASFRYGTAATGDYFYTNGLQLNAGMTYSASAGYITDGLTGWSEFSLLVGTSQSTTGLSNIVSATGALTNTVYVNVSNTFTVATSGIYYIAVKCIGNSSPWYLTFDDINVIAVPNPPVLNANSINLIGNQCIAAARTVTANITPGTNPLTSVVLSYSFNGVAQPTIALTGGNTTATSNWTGTIPVANPVNANVMWTITANDVTYARTLAGTSYNDEPLLGSIVTATSSSNPLCAGSSTTLSPIFSSSNPANYALPPAVTYPTSDEDIGNVLFGTLNNSSAINGLTGTIGTASGVAGSYSDFTTFGPYNFTAGNTYSMSLTSLQAATAYSNAFGVYIDYNRNGIYTDAGEAVYVSTVTTSGTHTETVSITIPATAKNGLTHMRVICNEGLVTGPTMPVYYGEYEEYMLNVSSANNGGGAMPTYTAYAWSNGTTIATTSTTVQSPAVNTTYSITATDANGCTITSAPLNVTVTPLPAAPTVTNSSQCGNGVPTAMVGGGSLYHWYATPTSTTVLQSSSSQFYTVSINTTTTFYVAAAVGTCESSRTALTANVTQPDAVTATTSAANICPAGSVTLTAVQSGTVNPYTFSWVAVPVAGSGLSSSVPGKTLNVTPTAPGTYIYSVTATDGICTTTSSVSVTSNNPPVITATANPTVICSGANVNLNATTPVIASGSLTVGAGSSTSSFGGSPFYHSWGGTKVQYIYTAAELNALGLSAGNITSLGLNVTVVGIPYEGFTINAGTTTQSAFATASTINGLTQVYLGTGTNNSYLPTVGINTFNFSTPINWNGTDNVVISICWSNATTGGASSTVTWDNYATNVGMYIYADSQTPSTVCSATTTIPASGGSSTTTGRPQTYINGQIQTSGAGPLTWQWNPGAINSNTTTVNPVNTGTAAATKIYTITGTNTLTTCSNTATVSILVNPLPATPVAVNATQCGLAIPTASVSGGTSYKWYATPTSTTVLQAGASANFTTAINATTTWYVSAFNGTCESVRAMLTESVTIPDGVTAASTSTAICPGSTFTLTATKTGTVNTYIYTWTATPAAGSGIPTSVTGATTAVTPTTSGTRAYLVTAVDGVCTTTASVNVTLNAPPNITNALATPSMVCSGGTVALSAISINAVSSTTTVGSGASTSGSGGSPFYHGWGGAKVQYIYTAAELAAQGLTIGNITSIGLNVTAVGQAYNGFAINAGTTSQSSFVAANTINGLTQVYLGAGAGNSYLPTVGINTFNFSTPIYWNGTDNVVISICWSNATTGGISSTVQWDNYSGNVGMYIYSDSQTPSTVCSATTTIPASGGSSTTTGRPLTYISGQIGTNVSSSINFVWNPGAIATNTAVVTPINTGTTAVAQIYTVTATNTVTGCTNTATTSVLVNPIPVTPTAFNSLQCGVAIPTASVTGGTSYKWYATPTATNAIQAGTSQTYTSSISTTTNFYVTSFNGNCESPRVTLTASVTVPDAVTASVGTASICPNTSVTLTAVKTGTANTYVYTWTGSPVAGSGIPTTVTGASVTITPTLSGTFVYTVTAVDAACTAVNTTTLIVFSALTTPPVTSSLPNPICIGSSATLSATFGNTINPVYAAPPTVFNPTNDEDFGNISFGPLANTTTTNSLIGTIGTASGTAGDYSDFTAFGPYTYIKGNTYTLTVGSITTGTSYSNAFGVYIDYNRNGVFTDAGEAVYISSATVSGPHTETTTVTIPASASTGVTRMRVISNEGLVTGPAMAVYYGEFEEYTLNLQPNITYNWTNGVTSVGTTNPLTVTPASNTTYSFTATDGNGCTINSTAVTVTVNPLPTINAVASNTTSCAASTVTLTASGATTYSWVPAGGTSTVAVVSPTTSTVYTLTGTALGCSSTKTVGINVTPTPTVIASASPSVICAGATVSLTASGATTYSWSPIGVTTATATATPTINTTYSIVGTALGCTTTKTVNVTVNHVPTLTVSASSSTLCTAGATATLIATGTSTAYAWSTGAITNSTAVTPSVTSTYTLTGTNSCGTSTASTIVNVGTIPTLSAVTSATIICKGNAAVLTVSGTATSYAWSTGAITTSISVTPTITTTYSVTGNSVCGAVTATVVQNVSPCTGIESITTSDDIGIYPNPATDHVTISISSYLASNNTHVEITDALGRLIMKENLNTDMTTIRLNKLEDGVYFFKVITNNQVVKIGKVVKQ